MVACRSSCQAQFTHSCERNRSGDNLATKENVPFQVGDPSGRTIVVSPDLAKQTIVGIGSSFTESWRRRGPHSHG